MQFDYQQQLFSYGTLKAITLLFLKKRLFQGVLKFLHDSLDTMMFVWVFQLVARCLISIPMPRIPRPNTFYGTFILFIRCIGQFHFISQTLMSFLFTGSWVACSLHGGKEIWRLCWRRVCRVWLISQLIVASINNNGFHDSGNIVIYTKSIKLNFFYRKVFRQDWEEIRSQCWPRDWLARDCPKIRILGVNYDTNISNWAPRCPISAKR